MTCRCYITSRSRCCLDIAVAFGIWLAVLMVYGSEHAVITSIDSMWTLHIATSLLHEGNLDLDEYRSTLAGRDFYAVSTINGHLYSFFPIGTAILTVPFVALADRLMPVIAGVSFNETLLPVQQSPLALRVELWSASCIAAVAVAIMYLIGRTQLSRPHSFLFAGTFAFSTSAWSTASRALWQQGSSMLLLALALYLLLHIQRSPHLTPLLGAVLAFAYIVRPTNSLPALLITILVGLRFRRYLPVYLVSASVLLLPWLWLNYHLYGTLLPAYYVASRLKLHPAFWEALAGHLISPARGLFVFSPILLGSIYGFVWRYRQGTWGDIDTLVVASLIGHWIIIAAFPHWWGGHSFGPRLWTDMLPFWMYGLLPVVALLQRPYLLHQWLQAGVIGALILVGAAINYRGATQPATWLWNVTPTSVDEMPARLWDWRDLQFLRVER